MNIVKIDRKSSYGLFKDVAQLHIAEIHFGFLPLMGEDFLSRLYYEMADLSETGLWIAEENGKVIGFILGASDFQNSYLTVLKKALGPLLMLGMRSLFKKDVLTKLPAILTYPFRDHSEKIETKNNLRISKAELLSIAVRAGTQGKGIGRELVNTFEKALIAWGQTGLYFVTTNSDNPDSNAFYRKLGFLPCGTQKHNDMTLQVYQKEIPEQKQGPGKENNQ